MLQKLSIRNYAIIEELDIDFSAGLNIITGETGAGKSIVMGALNLILGQRADSSVLQQKEKKCVVEGSFLVAGNAAVQRFFQLHELDTDEVILLRREIAANGRSRSFINDTPVNLSQLKELAVLLVDLHQQFDTLELGNENFQREVLDAVANNASLVHQLKAAFALYSSAKKQLVALQDQQTTADKELDYHRFLFDELDELRLKENELEELDAELKLLSNAETIKQQLGAIYFELKDNDQPLVNQLQVLHNKLKTVKEYHPGIENIQERLLSVVAEVKDIAEELENIDTHILYDAERIEVVNERLSAGYKLLKKHGVANTSQLIEIQESLQLKLDAVLNMSSNIAALEKQAAELYTTCLALAQQISTNRKAVTKTFSDKVNKLLFQVGMPNAQLKIQLSTAPLNVYGTDEITFLFDANKSNRFEPLHKVASGGELSRLMLSIKSLVARKLELPTLIFDEIDTGISGEAAKQVGIIMKELSGAHQLLAITHQPQIAARAAAHYFVYKSVVKNKISTSIRLLDNAERITAIAKMLSGEKPTAAALENAREMVST